MQLIVRGTTMERRGITMRIHVPCSPILVLPGVVAFEEIYSPVTSCSHG
jgi:hypothetical protein